MCEGFRRTSGKMGEDEVVANLLKDFEEALNDDKIYIAFELLKQLEMKAVDNKQIVQELEKRKVMIMTCQMLYTKIKVMVEGEWKLPPTLGCVLYSICRYDKG